MKLHLSVDAATDEIAVHALTDEHADDVSQMPNLLCQPERDTASLTADGAYDSDPVYRAAAARQPGRPPDLVIPPRSSAVPSTADPNRQSPRDSHICSIAEYGRMAWQRSTGYGRRNAAETTMARYKRLIGPGLRARSAATQAGEVALAVQMLNHMAREAKPITIRRR